MPNTNRHVDCQEYLTAVLRIAKITWDPQDRPAYNKCDENNAVQISFSLLHAKSVMHNNRPTNV